MAFRAPLLLLVSFCIASQIHAAPSGNFGRIQPWFESPTTRLKDASSTIFGQNIGIMGTPHCQYSDQTRSYSCCNSIIVGAVCFVVTYLPSNVGFSVNVTFNGDVFYQEISVKNPPPICLDKPKLVCLQFYNIDWGNKMVKGCSRVDLNFRLLHKQVEFGCFSFPLEMVGGGAGV